MNVASEIELYVVNRQGVRLGTLVDANLNFIEWVLNGAGSAEFTIDPMSPGAQKITFPNEIQVWFDGELVWWGVPWAISGGPALVTVTCEGLLSLFTIRFIDRTSLLYTSIDQFSIAWDLLTYAQSESVEGWRDFNINSSGFVASGVPRSRNYKRDEHAMILDLLKEFDSRELKNGFDWEIVTTGDGGRFWTPYFPRKGTAKPNHAIQWEFGEGQRNVSDFTWKRDYATLATLAYVTGGSVTIGETTFKKEGKYEDVSASAAIQTQVQTVISEGSELDEDFLEDRAFQEVEKRKTAHPVTEVTAARTVDLDAFGNVVVGDWLPVMIDHGIIQVDHWHRVETLRWNADNTLRFTFGETVVVA